jgi:hypothetical protein
VKSFLFVLLKLFEYGESQHKSIGKDTMYDCAHCLIHGLTYSENQLDVIREVRDLLDVYIQQQGKK